MVREKEVVQVFARTPIIGEVKTRLIPVLGPAGACELHKKMTSHLVRSLSNLQADVQIWTDKNPESPFLRDLGFSVIKQVGANLGEKMANAISQGLASYESVALIGTDLPELDSTYLVRVFEKLQRYKIVISPTLDGGFGLLAVKKFNSSIFDGLTWGTDRVFRDLVQNIHRLGLTYHIAPTLWDVDIPEDYIRLKEWLSQT